MAQFAAISDGPSAIGCGEHYENPIAAAFIVSLIMPIHDLHHGTTASPRMKRLLTGRMLSLLFALIVTSGHLSFALSPDERGKIYNRHSLLQGEMLEAGARGDVQEKYRIITEIIDHLQPHKSDYQISTMIIGSLLSRSSISASTGDWARAESDLLYALTLAKAMVPSDEMGEKERALYQTYRALAEFYLAIGNLKRAYQGYDAAKYFKQNSARKNRDAIMRSAAETGMPAAHLRRLLAGFNEEGISSEWSEGNFLKRLGNYSEAEASLKAQIRQLEENWSLSEADMRGSMNWTGIVTGYHRSRALAYIDLAELSIYNGNLKEASGNCQRALAIADEALAMMGANPTGISVLDVESLKKAGMPSNLIREMEAKMAELQKNIFEPGTTYDVNFFNYLKHIRIAEVFFSTGEVDTASKLLDEGMKMPEVAAATRETISFRFPEKTVSPERTFLLYGDVCASLRQIDKARDAYAKSLSLARAAYPESNPLVLRTRERIAFLNALNFPESVDSAVIESILDTHLKKLLEVISFGDEVQRLSYRATFNPWNYFATFNMPSELADMVVSTKGFVLESILEDRRRLRESGKTDQVVRLQALRRNLMERTMRGGAESAQEADGIRREIQAIEETLGGGAEFVVDSAKALQLSHQDVEAALPERSIILDFIRYDHYITPGESIQRYGALVLKRDQEPVFVVIGDAKNVDLLIENYTVLCRDGDDEDLEKSIREISKLILSPLEPHFNSETEKIFISPDGSLSFLSFGCLLTLEDAFLIENHEISYLINSRSLLNRSDLPFNKTAVIFADPNFDEPADKASGMSGLEDGSMFTMRGSLQGLALSPLPGTRMEEEFLVSKLSLDWNWEVQSNTAKLASEVMLTELKVPGILHLATHGFFLPDTSPPSSPGHDQVSDSDSFVLLNNPMHRSGLALAGANVTLEAWSNGIINNTSSDGIISAAELAGIDLSETWLVVLSACDTGLGKSVSGEGVLGIRHGLHQAGAQNVLLTLWPVADLETVGFMKAFYEALDQGRNNPPAAMAHAQREMLSQLRAEGGIALAVRIAGPFVLNQ